MIQEALLHLKGAGIDPIGFADPHLAGFIVTVIGVVDFAGRQQIGMNTARHGGGNAFGVAAFVDGPCAA
jgi:hypothetical protein